MIGEYEGFYCKVPFKPDEVRGNGVATINDFFYGEVVTLAGRNLDFANLTGESKNWCWNGSNETCYRPMIQNWKDDFPSRHDPDLYYYLVDNNDNLNSITCSARRYSTPNAG